jgi:protein SCO1
MTLGWPSEQARAGLALVVMLGCAPSAATAQLVTTPPVQAFVAPAAGSYTLPIIQPAAEGWVLEGNLVPRRLSNYTHGALTLLSFVYTYCSDPAGCPLAFETFDTLKKRVLADPTLRGQVRLVSLSFDPNNDTPKAMQAYGGEHARDTRLPWHFITTYSPRFLLPILKDFGQDVEVELDAQGRPTRARTHLLKVFLLDTEGQVREIYSAAFLHPDVMINDLKTLLMDRSAQASPAGRTAHR